METCGTLSVVLCQPLGLLKLQGLTPGTKLGLTLPCLSSTQLEEHRKGNSLSTQREKLGFVCSVFAFMAL